MLLYAFIRFTCFSHALKANVSQQQQQQDDRGSLVYRLYLRKPVKSGGNIKKFPRSFRNFKINVNNSRGEISGFESCVFSSLNRINSRKKGRFGCAAVRALWVMNRQEKAAATADGRRHLSTQKQLKFARHTAAVFSF